MSDDFYTQMKKEQEILNLSMKESIRQRDERLKVKYVHDKSVYCDGNGEHPTQTLLDLYTIWEKFNRIEDLTITFVGDIENSRTIHSLDKALTNCNKHYRDTYNEEPWPKSDVYYLTRVQKERGSRGSYTMKKEHTNTMPEESIVLHPFPRNYEIAEWFDTDPRAKYFEQMKNGLYVRMALLIAYTQYK